LVGHTPHVDRAVLEDFDDQLRANGIEELAACGTEPEVTGVGVSVIGVNVTWFEKGKGRSRNS
jgi:hypothetical protein